MKLKFMALNLEKSMLLIQALTKPSIFIILAFLFLFAQYFDSQSWCTLLQWQYNKDMLHKSSQLKIAFITDIHLSQQGLAKLSDFLIEHYNNENKFDYCIIGGDTANCNHNQLDHDEEEMYNATLQAHKKVKDMFCCKVFFVPGNHDCKRFFEITHPPLCGLQDGGFYNMHGRRLELTEGLQLIGFGGSVPGYLDGEAIWSGFPYNNDKQLLAEWQKSEFSKQKWDKPTQKILLTHCGPSLSETTLDRSQHPNRTVVTGSKFLSSLYQNKDIVCWLHGHTHNGSNNSKIGGTEVINPGPLCYFQLMYFIVVKRDGKWRLKDKIFMQL